MSFVHFPVASPERNAAQFHRIAGGKPITTRIAIPARIHQEAI
ncbi:MAG: hypothetical protein WBG17_01430 [Burkholderiaceae bacterium]